MGPWDAQILDLQEEVNMLIISHLRNISGANPVLENTVVHVDAALAAGFDAEVDVWMVDGKYMLGHDAVAVGGVRNVNIAVWKGWNDEGE